MATRRHRLVIKPNIRPAAPKAAGTVAPKAKTPPVNAGGDPPTPGDRPQQFLTSLEEAPYIGDSEEKPQEAAPDCTILRHVDMPGDAGVEIEQRGDCAMSKVSKDILNLTHTLDELSRPDKENVCQDDGDGAKTMSMLDNTNAAEINTSTPTSHQHKNPKLSTAESDSLALKSRDVINCAEVVKLADVDGHAVTPSEADSSCMSEAMSLDPDNDRQKEVLEKAQKKRKWQKSKKIRTEPLPSREKSPDRQKMKMSDLLLWNPQQNFLPKKDKKKSTAKSEVRSLSPTPSVALDDDSESTNQSASLPAPQIMIGPDGSIVLNTESLMVNTQKEDTKPKEILEDDDDDRYLNTNSYRKYQRTKQWTERETEKFFIGLSMCGTDFSLLSNLLVNRTRRELKNKFYREERRNRDLIDKALANRQQYDLTPFQKIVTEDEKKVKKVAKKRTKKEAQNDKKSAKLPKKKGRKKKEKESEDENDDWGQDSDEEDEENQNMEADKEVSANNLEASKKSKVHKVKTEVSAQKKSKLVDQNMEDNSELPVPKYEDYGDLDTPRMRSLPTKTYSKLSPEKQKQQQQPGTPNSGANFSPGNSVIQAIPGSTQVQIEMEGVQNPVQGVLIPSHMVPQIAPQLGIHGNPAGMQVLLVQEETASGSMVHVYVIPEGSTAQGSGVNSVSGTAAAGPNAHPAFASPIPSPHPSASIQSPGAASPYQPMNSSHPLAPVCSPSPRSPFHSPPPLHNPSTGIQPHSISPSHNQAPGIQPHGASPLHNPSTGIQPHKPHTQSHGSPLQPHRSPLQPNLHLQITSTGPHLESVTSNAHAKDISSPSSPTAAGTQQAPSVQKSTDSRVFIPPHLQPTHPSAPHHITAAASSDTHNLLPSPETSYVGHGCGSEVVVVDVEDGTGEGCSGDGSTLYNRTGADVYRNSEDDDDDCVIVDSDKPQSQLDKSVISCL